MDAGSAACSAPVCSDCGRAPHDHERRIESKRIRFGEFGGDAQTGSRRPAEVEGRRRAASGGEGQGAAQGRERHSGGSRDEERAWRAMLAGLELHAVLTDVLVLDALLWAFLLAGVYFYPLFYRAMAPNVLLDDLV